MVVPQKQPNGLKQTLYKYQLDAVNWMKSVEEDVDVGKWEREREKEER